MSQTVFVGVYEHKHGTDVAVYSTYAAAQAAMDDIADEFWENEFENDPRPESNIGEVYFDRVDDEYFTIEERAIID